MRNLVLVLFLYWLCPSVIAQPNSSSNEIDPAVSKGIFDLLVSDKYTEVTVKTDLAYLVENKRTSDEYKDGTFMFTLGQVDHSLPVKIKCRGRYRRVKCDFPPLKLKFKKDDLAAQGLNEFNELKLVTHCMNEKEKSKDLILREYAAYKLYNILSPGSFRVQLVKVNYLDSEKKKCKKTKGWGILIEDSDELAHRLGGEKFEQMGTPPEHFNARQEKITSLFNYMIGNSDWSMSMARNVEFIKYSENDISVISYDFDFAGLVNAPYAVPNTGLGQKTLQDRVYLGNPCSIEDMQPIFQYYLEKKGALMDVVNDADMLKGDSKNFMKSYLDSFFQIISDNEKAAAALFPEPVSTGE